MTLMIFPWTAKLRTAAKHQDVTLRNWSGPDVWIFAVYEHIDTFVGCVEVIGGTMRLHNGKYPPYKRERVCLDNLCTAFNTWNWRQV